MSLHHTGRWHYEFIPGREDGHQWRVADDDDDVIIDFATEEQARDCVTRHNENMRTPKTWKYGDEDERRAS